MAQYVMSMLRVSKIVPPKRQIIKDISLSFFPGAKIGLLDEPTNYLDAESVDWLEQFLGCRLY